MGEIAILHPKSCLKKHLTTMTSHRTIRFAHNSTSPSSQTSCFTVPDTRKQTPSKGILKNQNTNTVTQSKKNLVMGQVKILKSGEALQETSKVLKDVNHVKVKVSNRPENFEVKGRRVLPENKKMEKKDKNMLSNSSRGVQVSRSEDVVLSSTHRLGPDPEIVSKQMNKKVTECFSGSVFSDSPDPSSVPLPGFFMNSRSQTNS